MIELRPYQQDAIARLREALSNLSREKRLAILQAETGAGKTVMVCEPVRLAAGRGHPSLIVARGRELVHQFARTLTDWAVPHGVIMTGEPLRPAPVQVASKDTLLSWAFRHGRIDLPPASLLVIDECHESLAKQWLKIIRHYADAGAVVIGLTATPCRTDGRGLGSLYHAMVCAERGSRLVAAGHLVPATVYAPVTVDMKGVRKSKGEYDARQVAKRLDKPKLVGDVVKHWQELATGRATVVYCPTVEVSLHVRDQFRSAGVDAQHVDGKTDSDVRDKLLEDFSRERFPVLCNVGVLVQGVDVPRISCVVWYTATASLRKFRQGNGRGKRPFPGKTDLLVIDHAGNCYRHGLPDEDVEWSLDPGRKIEDIQQEKKPPGEKQPICCPNCHALFRPAPTCPQCGHVMQRQGQAAEGTGSGKLGLVAKRDPNAYTFHEKQSFWRSSLAIAANRNMKVGMAAARYRKEFGEWPSDQFTPAPPRGEGWKQSAARAYPQFLSREKRELLGIREAS